MIAFLFVVGALAQLVGIGLGAAELLGAHERARRHLAEAAALRNLDPVPMTWTDDPRAIPVDNSASEDLATLRGALAAAELNRNRVVIALVTLLCGVGLTLTANLAGL